MMPIQWKGTLVVTKVDDQGDRILLYGEVPGYHVIADPGCQAKVGDRVTYEPYGLNFGWFLAVQEESHA